MPYTPGILIGQITKTSGFEGTVIVRLEKRSIENIPEPESVFLEIEGRPVPFLFPPSSMPVAIYLNYPSPVMIPLKKSLNSGDAMYS
jgi:hypothetical protein